MYGFSVEINRCPDGVELVTLPAIQGGHDRGQPARAESLQLPHRKTPI
jgi:hypothetical protein